MLSYTGGRNIFGIQTKNTNTTNLDFGDTLANQEYKRVISLKDWPFLERTRTQTTIANTQFQNLPYDVDLVREVAVTVSNIRYVPALAPSREYWDQLNQNTVTSNIPQYYLVFNGQLGLWPTPSTSGNTITITARVRAIDLSIADYTTGTIVSIANGATTVTGSGTSWTSSMTGRYVRITYSDTANKGDGQWYEISSVTSTTVLELVRAYGGTTIAAGSAAYTIGQMPLLPEAAHDIPWNFATATYWAKESDPRSDVFFKKYEDGISALDTSYSSPTTDLVVDPGYRRAIINPNLTIQL